MKRIPCVLLPSMLALATLAGCASAPAPKPLEVHWELPENWSVARATDAVDVAGAGSLWWVELGAEPLAELVAEALTFNYDLRAAASRLGAAAAQARIAGAPLIPQLQAAGTGTRRRQNFIGFPIPGREQEALTTTSSNYGVSLNLSWELDLWGRLRAGTAAALADLMAADAVLRGARLSLVAQTARVYFACLEARRQVELADATMENQQLSARQVEARYERGLRPSLDVRLGRSSAAAAEAVLRQRQRQLDLVTRQLELLLGRYPRAVLQLEADLPPAPPPIPVGLPADLIGRRPDLVAAERHLAAAGARVTEARRSLYPRITLTTSGGRVSGALGDLLDGDFSVWSIAGGLIQPIFQGGLLRARVDLARSQSDQALAQFAQRALAAFGEVEISLAAAGFLAQQETALEIASQEALAARQLGEERYARGLADLFTVLESQRRAYDAESQLLNVRRQRLDNRIDLHLALGGGFSVGQARNDEQAHVR
jgi:NodT family efflux transporter outer membrane factor (OMF) lipoprotein